MAGTPEGKSCCLEIKDAAGVSAAFNDYIENEFLVMDENGVVLGIGDGGKTSVVELNSDRLPSALSAVGRGGVPASGSPLDIKDFVGSRHLILDSNSALHGIELDVKKIRFGRIAIQDMLGKVTPGGEKRLKVGFISGFVHVAFYGQSQVIGTTNGVVHSFSFDDNSLMFAGGLRSFGTPGCSTLVPEKEYYNSLVSMHEHASGETYCSGMAIGARAYIKSAYPNRDIKNIYTVNGAGGAAIDMLKKESASYNRMIKQHVALINLLASMGEAYHFPALGWSQGGSDDGLATNPDVWETAVEKLRTDYNADILSATGVNVEPVWITNQINNYMRYPALKGKPNIGLRQYKIVTNGKCTYAGTCPTYICDFIDVAHWTKESQIKVGAYYEKTRRGILDMGYWDILHPIKMTTTGKFSFVQFNLPQGYPLQFNTEFVVASTNYGFSAEQADGTPIGIDRVRLVSDDTIEIRYTDVPQQGVVLMYGQTGQIGDPNAADGSGLGRTHGMRGNLCDTAGNNEKIYVSASEPEYPLHNWCWMFTEDMGVGK
ncbi:hypothetical protein BHU62_19460 [Serratia marcescens]|uniref:Sialate O-acetylesterase domain-containing protein n=2 Tax=Serratia marcescens TaxID=615 RepID=A0A1Q4NW39_SERMA|nr:hypothetical protein BHU62_19460 [Serratia marcescens]